MSDLSKIRETLKKNPELRTIHAEALADLEAARRQRGRNRISAGLLKSEHTEENRVAEHSAAGASFDKIRKYLLFFVDCGIIENNNQLSDIDFVSNKIGDHYSRPDHEIVRSIVDGLSQYIIEARPTAPSDLSDDDSDLRKKIKPEFGDLEAPFGRDIQGKPIEPFGRDEAGSVITPYGVREDGKLEAPFGVDANGMPLTPHGWKEDGSGAYRRRKKRSAAEVGGDPRAYGNRRTVRMGTSISPELRDRFRAEAAARGIQDEVALTEALEAWISLDKK